MDRMPDGFANISHSQTVRADIQIANKAMIRALVTAADADASIGPLIGAPKETVELLANATPGQLERVYRIGLPLWDFRLTSQQLSSALEGDGALHLLQDGLADVVISQIVGTEIQAVNRAIIKAITTAAEDVGGITSELIGVSRETVERLARATPVQLNAVNQIALPLWVFRFDASELAKQLLNGDVGSTAITHQFLRALQVTRGSN
ncbi:hypothetical protein ACU4GI_47075 (plasmid) [Cupriavidus basilensis]